MHGAISHTLYSFINQKFIAFLCGVSIQYVGTAVCLCIDRWVYVRLCLSTYSMSCHITVTYSNSIRFQSSIISWASICLSTSSRLWGKTPRPTGKWEERQVLWIVWWCDFAVWAFSVNTTSSCVTFTSICDSQYCAALSDSSFLFAVAHLYSPLFKHPHFIYYIDRMWFIPIDLIWSDEIRVVCSWSWC